LAENIDAKNYITLWLSNIGSLYIAEKKYTEAENSLNRALAVAQEIGSVDDIKIAEENLSTLYSLTNKHKQALEHYKKYIAARDSITNDENTEKQTRLEMNYEFDKKIAANKAEQDKKDTVTQIIIYSVSAGLFLVLMLVVFIFRGYRQKQRANKLLESKNAIIYTQKKLVEEKQKETLDSIHYAKRIQQSLLPTEKYIQRKLNELNK